MDHGDNHGDQVERPADSRRLMKFRVKVVLKAFKLVYGLDLLHPPRTLGKLIKVGG